MIGTQGVEGSTGGIGQWIAAASARRISTSSIVA